MDNIELRIQYLYNAINDTQETIKFTDTKSGVVIVLESAILTAFITISNDYMKFLAHFKGINKSILIFATLIFGIELFISIFLSIISINPKNNPSNHIISGNKKTDLKYYLAGITPKMRLKDYIYEFPDSKLAISVDYFQNIVTKATHEDITLSLINEFLKLSYIKEKKIKRTQCSITWLKICFITVFLVLILLIIYKKINLY